MAMKAIKLAFLISIFLFAGAALYHAWNLGLSFGDPALAWFHGAFVIIDTTMAFLFWLRPRWLVLPFVVLTVQQIYSHGEAAWSAWKTSGTLDGISLFIALFMPALLVLLVYDVHNSRGLAALRD
jgi:hypothetical protein